MMICIDIGTFKYKLWLQNSIQPFYNHNRHFSHRGSQERILSPLAIATMELSHCVLLLYDYLQLPLQHIRPEPTSLA